MIVGGAQAIELVIRMVRIKLLAVLLGPSGVGLMGIYQSIIEWIGKFSGFGIRASAVRKVAEDAGKGDLDQLGKTILVLRRTCWATGLGGWLITVALARPLCVWTFGNLNEVLPLSIVGIVLLIENISAGQTALLQGMRKIEYLARVMIFSAVGGTIASIILYAWLGEKGIVSALIASACVNLFVSWCFSRKIGFPKARVEWRETAKEAAPLLTMGFAFMWAGVLTAGVTFGTRGLVARNIGIDASGIYTAAWGISGLFAGFILNAMSQDFYPRLTAAANDNQQMNQLVNEQAEIGLLLALPGLLATIAFSPLIIKIFYSGKFLAAAAMLPWFVIGIFVRVISWPIGFIQLAKGASKIFAISETIFNTMHITIVWVLLKLLGLPGVAIAFATAYLLYMFVLVYFADQLSGFRWSSNVLKLIFMSTTVLTAQVCIQLAWSSNWTLVPSVLLVLYSGIHCLRQLSARIGPEHKISIMISGIPVIGKHLIKHSDAT